MSGADAHAFKEWAIQQHCVLTAPVDKLKGLRVGIDAEDYLYSLLAVGSGEPLLPALGGLPFTLKKCVDDDLRGFRDAEIAPIFVFNGLDHACKDRASILREGLKASAILNEAWTIYDQGKGEDAVKAFGKACTYRTYHITRSLQFYLHQQGARIQTAPYSAAAQLIYLERKGYVHAVQGSGSLFVFGAEKVISTFDWDKKAFTWVTLQKCIDRLDVKRDQFIQLCLLSGCSILPAFPEVDEDSSVAKIQAIRNAISRLDPATAEALCSRDPSYLSLYHKACFVVKHATTLNEDGKVEQANSQHSPMDTHEFIGQRLPDELYLYLSRGVTGPRLLNWRTRMEIVELPPLDGGSSLAYRDLVQNKLRPLRAQALALMTLSLNRYYQKQDVKLFCWPNEAAVSPLQIQDRTDPALGADTWHVKADSMPQSASAGASPLMYAVSSLLNDINARKTLTRRPEGAGHQVREIRELRANTVWRFLQDRQYIDSDHTLSAWGKALSAALDQAKRSTSMADAAASVEIEEAVFLAFELIRLGVLNAEQMFPAPPYSGGPIRGSEVDKSHTLLISRVACLGKFQHSTIGYTGPLSRHLLAYHQTAGAVRGALRDLMEMHACHLLLSGAADRNIEINQYTELGASLPFVDEPDLGLALVVKSHLDELSNEAGRRQDIKKWFNHAIDIQADLAKAWKLWDAINAGVQAADTIDANTKKTFENADHWLHEKRYPAEIPNGSTGRVPE